jgi:hypothetical protein
MKKMPIADRQRKPLVSKDGTVRPDRGSFQGDIAIGRDGSKVIKSFLALLLTINCFHNTIIHSLPFVNSASIKLSINTDSSLHIATE